MRIWVVLFVLLSHWFKKPGQLVTLLIGLSTATGLWTGVQAINAEARSSYSQAASRLASAKYDSLIRSDGKNIRLETFVQLQQMGWRTSPIIEGRLSVNGRQYQMVGVDPLTMPQSSVAGQGVGQGDRLTQFLSPQGLVLAAKQTVLKIKDASKLPPIVAVDGIPPGVLMVDIAIAARILERDGELSRLVLLPDQRSQLQDLAEIAPQLKLIKPETADGIDRLTDSFHLNLTAFGLLSFAVGLFIVHGTIGLAFEQRRTVFRTLRVTGVSLFDLTVALALELMGFALIAGALGIVFGYFIAASLLPDVAATLGSLYGASVSQGLTFRLEWWGSGLAIAVVGTLFAASTSIWKLVKLPVLAAAQPRAWAMATGKTAIAQLAASLFLFVVAIVLYAAGQGLVVGFAIVGTTLIGAALALPQLFMLVLKAGERMARGPLGQWFWADTRQQVPGLSLALMALLLALAANIGVSTMVGSFRTTFNGWLDQRLAAELYIRASDNKQGAAIVDWLKPRVDAVLPVWNADVQLNGQKGKVFGVANHATYRNNWPLLSATKTAWDDVASGNFALINEQMARRQNLSLGSSVTLANGTAFPISGIYSDYGNPQPQVMVSNNALLTLYPQVPKHRYAVRLAPNRVNSLMDELVEEFELERGQVVNQITIKNLSISVFEQTFSVTGALNILTLAVAGFAIFTSLLTLATMRLPQLAPVWALGLTRRKLALLELVRALLLALLTIIAALPVGLILAWLLLAVVNVEAFGWRLPMQIFVGDWFRLALLALVAACLAAAIPARRLAKIAPAELVKVFAHER